eukprot:PhM_4_TR3028/c0_g1_i1/m.41405
MFLLRVRRVDSVGRRSRATDIKPHESSCGSEEYPCPKCTQLVRKRDFADHRCSAPPANPTMRRGSSNTKRKQESAPTVPPKHTAPKAVSSKASNLPRGRTREELDAQLARQLASELAMAASSSGAEVDEDEALARMIALQERQEREEQDRQLAAMLAEEGSSSGGAHNPPPSSGFHQDMVMTDEELARQLHEQYMRGELD